MTYLENLDFEMINSNIHALKCVRSLGGDAWDNRKRKTQKTLLPRGRVVQRLNKLQTDKSLREASSIACSLSDIVNELNAREL